MLKRHLWIRQNLPGKALTRLHKSFVYAVAIAAFASLALVSIFAASGSAAGTTPATSTTTSPSTSSTVLSTSTATPSTTTATQLMPDVNENSCYDTSISSGTIYSSPGPGPNFTNFSLGTFTANTNFNLSCYYYNNTSQSRYYAEIQMKTYSGFNGKRYGYVWVQRLTAGQDHQCISGPTVYAIGSSACPLTNVP